MAGTLPPLFTITDDDHAGYVCVVAYTLLILSVLLVITRVFTRYYVVRFIKSDDIFLMAAGFLATLQVTFVQLGVNHGLGRTKRRVTDSDFALYQKYEYAAQIVLIAAVACAKISLVLLIQTLMVEGLGLHATRGLLVIVVLWAFTSIMGLAFQCYLPHPWDSSGQCINQNALYDAIGAINIITDVALILLPSITLWRIRVSSIKRYGIVGLLATRVMVCAATAMQIHYYKTFIASTDKTWFNVKLSIWDQVMMHFSIIATALPSLGRVMIELQPAVNAFAITEHHGIRADKFGALSFVHQVEPDYSTYGDRLAMRTMGMENRARW